MSLNSYEVVFFEQKWLIRLLVPNDPIPMNRTKRKRKPAMVLTGSSDCMIIGVASLDYTSLFRRLREFTVFITSAVSGIRLSTNEGPASSVMNTSRRLNPASNDSSRFFTLKKNHYTQNLKHEREYNACQYHLTTISKFP